MKRWEPKGSFLEWEYSNQGGWVRYLRIPSMTVNYIDSSSVTNYPCGNFSDTSSLKTPKD